MTQLKLFDDKACRECGSNLPSNSHPNTKYCSDCKPKVRRRQMNEYGRDYYAQGKRGMGISREPGYQRPSRKALEDGLCEICGEFGPLCRDHDNSCCTGRFGTRCGNCERGELCRKCNSLLGLANDSLKILFKAIDYLENSGGGQ